MLANNLRLVPKPVEAGGNIENWENGGNGWTFFSDVGFDDCSAEDTYSTSQISAGVGYQNTSALELGQRQVLGSDCNEAYRLTAYCSKTLTIGSNNLTFFLRVSQNNSYELRVSDGTNSTDYSLPALETWVLCTFVTSAGAKTITFTPLDVNSMFIDNIEY